MPFPKFSYDKYDKTDGSLPYWVSSVLGAERGLAYPLLLELVWPAEDIRLLTRVIESPDELKKNLNELSSKYTPEGVRVKDPRTLKPLWGYFTLEGA